jgi:PrgI family protein
VPARIPLDVDLEDRLLYGLTPIRLVYLVVALLAAFSTWSTSWAPVPVRAPCAVVLAAFGIAAAWGRWRGRPLDAWAVDIAVYCLATYRIRTYCPRWLRRLVRRR